MTANVSSASAALTGAGTSPFGLPRARALTDAIVAPGRPAIDEAGLANVTDRLIRSLDETVQGAVGHDSEGGVRGSATGCLRIGRYQVATAASTDPAAAPGPAASRDRPFRWSAQAARRRLGLAAVRMLVDRQATAPADAVAKVLTDPCAGPGTGGAGAGSCAEWVTSLAAPARAIVEAEATNWATRLWTGVEWWRLDPAAVVGAADRWWAHRGRIPVALRGRAEVRARAVDGAAVLLTIAGGWPGSGSLAEMSLAALVDALAGGCGRCPARVVGWWPDCGRVRVVTIDAGALEAAAGAVVRAVEASVSVGAGETRSIAGEAAASVAVDVGATIAVDAAAPSPGIGTALAWAAVSGSGQG